MASALIIDDNSDNRRIFRTILMNIGMDVQDYGDPVKALAVLNEKTYDLLILDLQMPILDGTKILKAIRPNATHESMCIVVVTAFPHFNSPDIDERADYVMNKPISPTEFAAFVRRITNVVPNDASRL